MVGTWVNESICDDGRAIIHIIIVTGEINSSGSSNYRSMSWQHN